MPQRKVVKIDEEKCDGCGLCIPACPEGALQIVDGKARLVKESYCDGLGACLGHCPRGAITIEEREAEEFDERAVHARLAEQGKSRTPAAQRGAAADVPAPPARAAGTGGGCPGAQARLLRAPQVPHSAGQPPSEQPRGSQPEPALANWPVQISLVPTLAPYFDGAHLLVCADCVPFAYPRFHEDLLRGRIVAIGCPKLDDGAFYRDKLAEIFRENNIASVAVAHMEVPCCFSLVQVVHEALAASGKDLPLALVNVGIDGEIRQITNLRPGETENHARPAPSRAPGEQRAAGR